MQYVIKVFTSDTFWNFITVISSLVIVRITLTAERKNNKTNLELQEKHHKVGLEIEERIHAESIKIEKEQVRANLLPFLKLNQEINIGQRNGNFTFPLKITNYGNSGAFDIIVEFKTLEGGLCYVYEYKLFEEIEYYQYTGFLYDNVLPVSYSGTFELLLNKFKNGKYYQQQGEKAIGKICFSILFKDSLYNQYRQQYMIQYSSDMGCGRVESYLPRVISESYN